MSLHGLTDYGDWGRGVLGSRNADPYYAVLLVDARNRGENTAWERLRVEGVGPPMAPPPNLNLVGFTGRFASKFTNITSKFTTILE